jgi:hypothetical protein
MSSEGDELQEPGGFDPADLTCQECEAIVRLGLAIGKAANNTLLDLQGDLSPAAWAAARGEAAAVLALIYTRILVPVQQTHPDALPPGLLSRPPR